MKKYIEYYYDCKVDKISYNSYGYDVVINNKKFVFKSIDSLVKLEGYKKIVYYLKQYNYFFEIIPNRFNLLYIYINNKIYILLKLSNIKNSKISIYDIKTNLYLSGYKSIENYSDFWVEKWEKKIDYLELWIEERKTTSNELYSICQFYIGLGELGIAYLKNNTRYLISNEYDEISIQHNRICVDSSLYDYYDPTNIVIDHNSRDISEYIKSVLISNVNMIDFVDVLDNFFDIHSFSKFGFNMLYGRIIFPTYFFDYLEEILQMDKIKEENVNDLEQITLLYEKRIRILNELFKNKYHIEVIDTI